MSAFTLEKSIRIYNDGTGDYVEVREDRDALELIEIVQSENQMCVMMPVDQARLLCKGILEVCDHIESRGKKS
jgi:hypothetical protein